jgi:predicted Zn-dependent protease
MSTEKILRLGCLLILALGLLLGFGAYFIYQKLDFSPVSSRFENMLEEHIVPQILDNWTTWEDPHAQETLDSVTSRLLGALETPGYNYQFHLVTDNQINALTLPGGHIVVFKGLMENVTSPEQIAAVLAHELGHAEKRHVISRTLAEGGIGLFLSIVLGQDSRMGFELSRQILSSYFSREQESEADTWGFDLLVKAQIDPQAHADFFRIIEKLNGEGDIPSWLSTHPDHASRIQAAENYALPQDFKAVPLDTVSFSRMYPNQEN